MLSRDAIAAEYAGIDAAVVAAMAAAAATGPEVDRVRLVALLNVGYPALNDPVDGVPLARRIADAYIRVGVMPDHVDRKRAAADAEHQLAQARAARRTA